MAGLGLQDIIVCGHSHCGAMQGLLHPESLSDMPAMTAWLSHAEATRRIMREKYADRTGDALLTPLSRKTCWSSSRTCEPTAWVYKIESGAVFAYEPARGQFIPVAEYTRTGAALGLPEPRAQHLTRTTARHHGLSRRHPIAIRGDR